MQVAEAANVRVVTAEIPYPTIAGLVVEYINTIMEDRATPALPKRSLGTSASD